MSTHALRGVPPVGLGLYTRDRVEPGPWRWRVVDPRIRGGALVREAQRSGPVWLFAFPDSWEPRTWRETLARLVASARELGAEGVLCNPEAGWGGSSVAERQAFGAALREASKVTRIGVVTIPGWPALEVVAREAGRGVWWSPEFYSQSVTEEQVRGWWSRWRRIVGGRMIPTIGAFLPPRDTDGTLATAEGYRRYLESIPLAGGVAVWPTYPIRPYMVEQLAARYGGARSLMLAPLGALGVIDSWGGAVLLATAIALVLLAAVSPIRRT